MSCVFVGATLIDGTGSPPASDAAVVVSDGRIETIGRAPDLDRPDAARVVDIGGKFVIPGLMDANVHLVLDLDPAVLLRYEPGCYDDLVIEAAQIALKAGVTTVFDTWGPLESLRRVRDLIDAGKAIGSRIFVAGNIIGNAGPWSSDFFPAYGESLNPTVVDEVNRHWEQGVGGELPWMASDDVRKAVRAYIAKGGIDFVKYASTAHGPKKFIALSPESQRAIVEEAHEAGLTVQACAMTSEALKLAIDAGVDLLQHGTSTGLYPMPDETMDVIVTRQLPCVAFLFTERYIAAVSQKSGMTDSWEKRVVVHDVNGRALIRRGAKLLHAADSGVFTPTTLTSSGALGEYLAGAPDVPWHLGGSHLLWLQAAIEREMEPMDALLAATRNVAEAYRKDDELGTIEPGKRADFVVLDGDPLADVANYSRVVHVVKDGEIVDRDALPERPVLTRDAA